MEHAFHGIFGIGSFKLVIFCFLLFDFNRRYKRNQVLFANTLFQTIAYHPEEFHIVTGGSDRKVAYWESYDGVQIRELEASKSGNINGLDIDANGALFVTASSDKLIKVKVKLYKYNHSKIELCRLQGMEI